ncbi:iron-sulfur cluster assembly scaffold protein [Sulfurimonas paralvinellae]|uniref:Iron-sulfur cluster assembly scaffold protein n=1 Tax=Sulfurimonas paralvinellae TaxID=317658 RepID=A0A7M1B750_9BACT|nr:iron-sulfur cluster assembly scaffold protein [Sulfurimonas paralvinellae]QOP45569.1 iron-sulfur cluster assembly scaffold protein [Sulfurimonas paralvinellae]
MFEDVKMPEGMSPEALEHLMYPKNYGKLDDADGVGVALDEKTGEYVIFYTKLDNELIKDVKYATNGCQDTVVIGSMFTEMILGNDLDYAQQAVQKMHEKLGKLSPKQQVCADIVFTAFIASLKNKENRDNGADEELHVLKMKESCEIPEQEGENDEK